MAAVTVPLVVLALVGVIFAERNVGRIVAVLLVAIVFAGVLFSGFPRPVVSLQARLHLGGSATLEREALAALGTEQDDDPPDLNGPWVAVDDDANQVVGWKLVDGIPGRPSGIVYDPDGVLKPGGRFFGSGGLSTQVDWSGCVPVTSEFYFCDFY